MGVLQQSPRARQLRQSMTEAETRLWFALRRRQLDGFYFRRQFPVGPYIADFACTEARVIVEADGGQHAERQNHDATRTQFLNDRGYRVLRFWNNDVLTNINGVLTIIRNTLLQANPLPNPPPASREREKDV